METTATETIETALTAAQLIDLLSAFPPDAPIDVFVGRDETTFDGEKCIPITSAQQAPHWDDEESWRDGQPPTRVGVTLFTDAVFEGDVLA